MIFDICQTRDGFLWVATKDGLNRYDGYNFKIFTHNPFAPYTLAENTSVALFEDSRGLLWVATESKGVDVYDHRSGRFHHFPRLQAKAFSEGGDGDLWAVTKGELVRLAIPDGWGNMPLPENPDLTALVPVQKVLIEGYAGLPERLVSIWPKEDGNFVLFSSEKHYEVSSAQNAARPLPGPSFGRVPQGAYQNGGHVWIVADLFSVHHLYRGQTTRYAALNSLYGGTSNFHKDGQGRFWFSAKGALWQLEPGRPLDPSKPDYVLDQDVTCLRSDRNGNLWIGTLGYGLRKINPKRKAFHTAAPNKSAWRLWKSLRGTYYWRDFVEIYTYDPVTGAHNTPAFPDLHEAKLDMSFDEDGTIWLLSALRKSSIETLGAYGADGRLKQQYRFDINASDYSLLNRTRDGNFWITEAGASLSCFDTRSNQIRRFDYSHLFGEKAALVQSFAFAQDGNGDFWIGTQQGLVKCGMGSGTPQFQLMQTDPGNPQGLNHNVIACLLPDPVRPGEVLWIGTKGGGINRLDIRSGQVRHFTTEDGLPDMVVYGILPGNERPPQGRPSFWCSTNRGLAKLVFPETLKNDEKPAITVFSAAKGLQDSEFNTQAFFKTHDGELLFGGINGFNHFLPEAVLPDTARPPVFVVGISINHEAANLGQRGLKTSLDCLRELQLDYDENNVSFEFAALDFTDPAQNRYRYRLVGADDDWVATKGTRFAHFAHLAPGRYEFRVQGSNGESAWRDAWPITVIILPPWWSSNLAYLCYFLLLAWAGWRVYRFQIQRLLEREQLALEHRETERVKALEQLKTNFFSNITHEFRTPLTLMIEPLRQLVKNPNDRDRDEKIRLAERNSRQLLGLVNQLLDMAKLESGQMSLDVRRADIGQTVRDVFETFLPLAEKRGVKLIFRQDLQDLQDFEFDSGKVQLILNNLISNALKFTPQGGQVDIHLGSVSNPSEVIGTQPFIAHHSSFIIQVKDTGVGIAPEFLGKIFDRFYQVDGSHTRAGEGTGIGLALSKELAELMSGGITVESEVGKGSVFTFWFPVQAGAGRSERSAVQWAEGVEDLTILKKPESPNPSPAAEQPVALVIEDNAELRHFINNALGDGGWQVVEASDGEEGLKRAFELLPDLVISDVMMPRKDGFAVVDELKSGELTAHIPVILLTAKSAVESKIKGLRTGADDYLTKPFNTEELLARMENLVEMRRRLRERYGQGTAAAPDQEPTSEAAFPSSLDRDFMRRFTLMLEQYLSDEHIGVEDFARKMSVSRVQLYRKLKALTDQSVTDFVRAYRLDKAMVILKNREGNVGDVASKVGFGSESYFSRAFKERFGISPSQVM